MKGAIVIAAGLLAGGCAHVAEIIDNQDIETSHLRIKPPGGQDTRMVTLDRARRLIRSEYDGKLWRVCAETQADAIASRNARVNLTADNHAALEDSIDRALTTTYTRTELSDTVRQLSWQVCNNRANGYIADGDVRDAMNSLISGSMLVLQLRAQASPGELSKVKQDLATMEKAYKDYVACVAEAKGDAAKTAGCKKT